MYMRIKIILIGLAAFSLAAAAHAGDTRAHKPDKKTVREAPPKDCTRFNGRIGYYGNPWCTPAEQARWDKWSAQRR